MYSLEFKILPMSMQELEVQREDRTLVTPLEGRTGDVLDGPDRLGESMYALCFVCPHLGVIACIRWLAAVACRMSCTMLMDRKTDRGTEAEAGRSSARSRERRRQLQLT